LKEVFAETALNASSPTGKSSYEPRQISTKRAYASNGNAAIAILAADADSLMGPKSFAQLPLSGGRKAR